MAYIPPNEVTSPQRHWQCIQVLNDNGEGESALALGRWDNKGVLAVRWNGVGNAIIGNPQSRGLATWFILPDDYCEAVIGTLPEHAQAIVRSYILNPRERRAIELIVREGEFIENPIEAIQNVAAQLGEAYETVRDLISSLEKRHMLRMQMDPPRIVGAEPPRTLIGRYVKGPDA